MNLQQQLTVSSKVGVV